ncbi:MAG: PAS domain-containing protein [Candidatus Eisenbacteria bacterium]|nr:PAS domain-containing protein [Candidatus Latescibacterota bacterium]MBD3301337.1 PAS domain-containing protein [Candidatus Eisenbacteria bacterium]
MENEGRMESDRRAGGEEASMNETTLIETDRGFARMLLDALDSGIVAVDTAGKILFLNRRAQELFGLDPEEVRQRPVTEILQVRAPARGTSLWPPEIGESMTREMVLSSGDRELTVEARWLPVVREENDLGGILAFEDITEAVGELEFQRRLDRFASIGNLSAVIAHEIRNPLTGVRTTIQFVGSKMEGELRTDLEDVIKELDRIEQFTTDLLQFARPKTLEKRPGDVNEVMEKVLDTLSAHFEHSEVQLKRDSQTELPRIPMDFDAMHQVLLNIIRNALEAMPDGGTLKVTTSSRRYRSRTAVEIAVSDTGSGIEEEMLDRIFDPFFTTKPSGTGLGLSISLQLVQEHGGRINVRNRSQGGVTFRLSFPVPIGEDAS